MHETNQSFDFAATLKGETLTSSSSFDFAKTLRSNIPEADDGNLAERFGQRATGNSDRPWFKDEPDDSRVRPDDELDLRQQRILSPRLAWNQYSKTARSIDLSDWLNALKKGDSVEDWQRQALEDEGLVVKAGEEEQASPDLEEESDENQSTKKGATEKMGEFLQNYDWGRLARDGVHVLVPFLTGGALTTILSPEQAHNLIVTAFGVGGAGFLGAGACAITEKILPRHLKTGRLASTLAVMRVTSAVFAEAGMLMGVGATSGVALHAREAFDSGMKLLNDDVLPAGNKNHAGADASPQFGGTSLDERDDLGRHFGGFSPDERGEVVVQPPVGGGADTSPQFPTQDSPLAPVKPEDLGKLPNLTDSAEAAKQAAETARIAALNQGQTVAELAKTMPQGTVSEAVHQIVGNGPHSLEIVNVIDRAAQDDVLRLHEGAIREMAKALSEQFAKADAAAAGMGVPYNQGGLQAAEQMYGANSPVVHAIRAANLENQMESAGVVREFLRPILQGLAAK